MTAVEGLGRIEEFISTTEARPLETPNQPQQTLGQIVFASFDPKKDYQSEANHTKLRHEKAALYLVEQWQKRIAKPFSTQEERNWGPPLYVGLHSDDSLEPEERKSSQEWKEEGRDTKASYTKAAAQALKAVLLRGITRQQERAQIDVLGDYEPSNQSLYLAKTKNQSVKTLQSLGQIAYNTRFAKDEFQKKSPKIRSKWEEAAQYVLYFWHQRVAGVIAHYTEYTSGAHLFIGINGSRDNGYEMWHNEMVDRRNSYDIASSRVMEVFLLHIVNLQQRRIDGQPSSESLFPA